MSAQSTGCADRRSVFLGEPEWRPEWGGEHNLRVAAVTVNMTPQSESVNKNKEPG